MRLVCVLFTFENNTGPTDGRTDGPTDRRTDGHNLIYRCDGASKKDENIDRLERKKREKRPSNRKKNEKKVPVNGINERREE